MKTFALLVLCGAATAACTASVGTGALSVPKDAPQTCAEQCAELGMSLDALVTIAGKVGCVCSPAKGRETTKAGATAAAAGAAASVVLQEQQQQQQTSK